MQYKQLGKTELRISRIGFGCMSLGLNQKENEKLLDHAIDHGINYFDTADIYANGNNEISVGKAIKAKRHKVVLATKGGNEPKAPGSGWNWNPSKQYILTACEQSLKRLRTDYIDLYQLHGGTIDDPIGETISAFEQLQQEGKIRYYGLSSIRPNVIAEYVKRSSVVSVMMQYSLLDRRSEEACLPLLEKNSVGVLARGSIATGLLVNKPAKEYLNYTEEQVKQAAGAIREVSGDHRTPAQTAFQFVLKNQAITSAVVGIRTLFQLDEATSTLNVPPLSNDELKHLKSALEPDVYNQYR